MTLIAYNADGDHAEILTDTLAYNGSGAKMAHNSKVRILPHLDAAFMTQGDVGFGQMATVSLASRIFEPTFDALVKVAPAELRDCWRVATEGPVRRKMEGTAFLVGWSDAEGRFVGWRFHAEHDFEPEREDGPFMMPSPTTLRASDFELDRIAAEVGASGAGVVDNWRREEPLPTPETTEDWVSLGLAAYKDRSQRWLKVFIGGSLHLTRLERGKQTTERVHTFDSAGEDFAVMVSGTLHPQGQAAPCPCGSGVRFIDCCLAPHLDEPCPCGVTEGATIRECCAITAQEAEAATA